MTLDEIDCRNPGALRHTEVVNEDGVAYAHLVEGVAAHRRHLHASFGAVNFDQSGFHRVFRATSRFKSRMETGNLESLQKKFARISLGLPQQRHYEGYQSCTRYTENSDKPATNRKKQHKLIKLENTFAAQVASKAPHSLALGSLQECFKFKVLAFEPITACRVIGVKSSCSRGVSGSMKSKNIGEK
jgi:hypothetical protein